MITELNKRPEHNKGLEEPANKKNIAINVSEDLVAPSSR
jgi:hypothetical protein